MTTTQIVMWQITVFMFRNYPYISNYRTVQFFFQFIFMNLQGQPISCLRYLSRGTIITSTFVQHLFDVMVFHLENVWLIRKKIVARKALCFYYLHHLIAASLLSWFAENATLTIKGRKKTGKNTKWIYAYLTFLRIILLSVYAFKRW